MSASLVALFETESIITLADVRIECDDGKVLYCNRAALQPFEFFRAAFRFADQQQKDQQTCIRLPSDVPTAAMACILAHMFAPAFYTPLVRPRQLEAARGVTAAMEANPGKFARVNRSAWRADPNLLHDGMRKALDFLQLTTGNLEDELFCKCPGCHERSLHTPRPSRILCANCWDAVGNNVSFVETTYGLHPLQVEDDLFALGGWERISDETVGTLAATFALLDLESNMSDHLDLHLGSRERLTRSQAETLSFAHLQAGTCRDEYGCMDATAEFKKQIAIAKRSVAPWTWDPERIGPIRRGPQGHLGINEFPFPIPATWGIALGKDTAARGPLGG